MIARFTVVIALLGFTLIFHSQPTLAQQAKEVLCDHLRNNAAKLADLAEASAN